MDRRSLAVRDFKVTTAEDSIGCPARSTAVTARTPISGTTYTVFAGVFPSTLPTHSSHPAYSSP
jgi:hypothetical protein